MAHQTTKSSYAKLVDRLNRFPQGAPPSDLLFKILAMLFSEKEAGLVASLPIKPFTVKKASRIWKMDLMMAIERGKLQNLSFDNRVLWHHRVMAAFLGVILKLPPLKQVLANQQVKSRYLKALINYNEKRADFN